jgi:hypothetical protein
MIALLLFTFALASDQNQVVLPSGRVVYEFSSKRFGSTRAAEIRDAVAKLMEILPASRVKLVGDKEKILKDVDVVDKITTITAIIQQHPEQLAVPEPPRFRRFEGALATVRDGAMAYSNTIASMACTAMNDDYGRGDEIGAAVCLVGFGIPVGITFLMFLFFHAALFGKFEWELRSDAFNNVCGRFKLNTAHLDKNNPWDGNVIEFCKDGWETEYTRIKSYPGLCCRINKGCTTCLKSKQVPDDAKNEERTRTLRRREYALEEIADEVIVETDALVRQRNEQFKRKENRPLEQLKDIKAASDRLQNKYKRRIERERNKRKFLYKKN